MVELRVDDDVKVVVDLLDLSEVFVLHFSPGLALFAIFGRVWEKNLVNDDVLNVYLLLSELDCQPLRLIHGQELRYADGHESGLLWVLELPVDLFDFGLHTVHCVEQLLLQLFGVHLLAALSAHHSLHRRHHATEALFELDEFLYAFVKDARKVQ